MFEYVGSDQEYRDQMNEEWWDDRCPGCGRPADVDCHEQCRYNN